MSNKNKGEIKGKSNKVKKSKSSDKIKTSKELSKKDKIINFIKDNKSFLLFGLLCIINIILIIWFAKDNYANYAVVDGENIFVGKTKNLLFGRNYIGLIVTLFIYIYGVVVDRFFFKNKVKIKWLIIMFCGLFIMNMLLFSLFTNKIY